MLQNDVIFHNIGIVSLFFMQSGDNLLIFGIECNILSTLLLFKLRLLFLHLFHYVSIECVLLFDFFPQDFDLLATLINFIVWHVDGTEDVRLFGTAEAES